MKRDIFDENNYPVECIKTVWNIIFKKMILKKYQSTYWTLLN